MKLVTALVAPVVLVACAADGEVKVKASSDESMASANANASAETEPKSETKTTAAKPSEGDAPAAAPASGEAPAPQACPLQCFVAQKGRVAPADEQRLAGDLADALSSLRACGPGNSLTIRFDSGGQLTEFGVAADRGAENSCIDSVRQKKPNVSFPGPSTLRCYEKCGGDTSTRPPRRRTPKIPPRDTRTDNRATTARLGHAKHDSPEAKPGRLGATRAEGPEGRRPTWVRRNGQRPRFSTENRARPFSEDPRTRSR
jgi:hypothetical protein